MVDYIERQAAFNMMFSRANPYGGQEKVNPADIWNQAATIIRTMPDSSVREDVQGKWLKPDYPICCAIKCSVCGETEYLDDPDQYEHYAAHGWMEVENGENRNA